MLHILADVPRESLGRKLVVTFQSLPQLLSLHGVQYQQG